MIYVFIYFYLYFLCIFVRRFVCVFKYIYFPMCPCFSKENYLGIISTLHLGKKFLLPCWKQFEGELENLFYYLNYLIIYIHQNSLKIIFNAIFTLIIISFSRGFFTENKIISEIVR